MDVNSGGSFGCNPFRKEIGIGRATSIDELVIQWPASGTEQIFRNVSPRQFLTIEEGNPTPKKESIRSLVFRQMDSPQQMIDCAPLSALKK
jgi:hypothetical protein